MREIALARQPFGPVAKGPQLQVQVQRADGCRQTKGGFEHPAQRRVAQHRQPGRRIRQAPRRQLGQLARSGQGKPQSLVLRTDGKLEPLPRVARKNAIGETGQAGARRQGAAEPECLGKGAIPLVRQAVDQRGLVPHRLRQNRPDKGAIGQVVLQAIGLQRDPEQPEIRNQRARVGDLPDLLPEICHVAGAQRVGSVALLLRGEAP